MIGNQVKTVLLLAGLTGILLVIGQLIGGFTGLTVALGIAIVMNLVSYWYSDKIVLFIYRAKLASESEYPKLHEIARDLSTRSGLPKPRLYIINSDNPNAFATGRNYQNSAVAVTTGILSLLDTDELKGVLAHEFSHIKNRDILISTIAATIAGAIAYVAFIARFAAIFGGMRGEGGNGRGILELIILAILAPIIATIIRLAISRSREYLADESGAKMIQNSLPLASALTKLHSVSKIKPMRRGSETTAHMFIVNPFSGRYLLNLFSSHPPIHDRVGKLRAMKF